MVRTSAAEFLLDRYKDFESNRASAYAKWRKNWENYNAVVKSDVWKKGEARKGRSTSFFNITHQKCVALASIVLDTIMQGGKMPFMLKMDMTFSGMAGASDWGIDDEIQFAEGVYQDIVETTKADQEFIRQVMALGIYGLVWGKNIVREATKTVFLETAPPDGIGRIDQSQRRFEGQRVTRLLPSWICVLPWNMFWDMETARVDEMSMIIHQRTVSPYELRRLALTGGSGIDIEAVKRVMGRISPDGTLSSSLSTPAVQLEPLLENIGKRTRTILLREAWGRIPVKCFEEYEKLAVESGVEPQGFDPLTFDDYGNEVEVMGLLADDEVIALKRVKVEDRPFTYALCEIDPDSAVGRGVADNLSDAQDVINGALRAYEDNKRLSANIMGIGKLSRFKKEPTDFEMGAYFELSEDAEKASDAWQQMVVQDVGETLMSLIQFYYNSVIDDASLIPKISQGLTDMGNKPSTAFEIGQRVEKSQKYAASIIRNIDEGLIEPHIGWINRYNLLDPESGINLPFAVQALGFTSFQNRVVKQQKLVQFMTILSQDRDLAIRFKKEEVAAELARTMDLDPDKFKRSPEEIQQLMAEQNPPPPPPPPSPEPANPLDEQAKMLDMEHKQAQTEHVLTQAEKTRMDMDHQAVKTRHVLAQTEKTRSDMALAAARRGNGREANE